MKKGRTIQWIGEKSTSHSTTLFPLKAALSFGVGLWNNQVSPEVSSLFLSTPPPPQKATCRGTISFAFLRQAGYAKCTLWPRAGEEAAGQTRQTFGPSTVKSEYSLRHTMYILKQTILKYF